MTSPEGLRPRSTRPRANQTRTAQPRTIRTAPRDQADSAFANGQPFWHFVLDAGALTVLLGLGLLGFGLSFGGDPYYLLSGFGGIFLGLAVGALNAHLRLGLLITTALALGAYLVFGTLL
ncbi:MAG: transglutaminase, partial [Arthrobacter sp.]|nr:transglutaminase [Arthrobacter sp.]